MNLLPKSSQEFAHKDYWNKFFERRGDRSFEWYGEYLELCEPIHKYVKPADKILMVGCGNSKLSMDMYDSGFKNITNIDISHVAIKKMSKINENIRPDMEYLQMDATEMSFADEAFSVIIDKGTLDALMSNDSSDVCETVGKYFNEIVRTMRVGGRYICISLLQEHILKYMLEFFPNNSFMVRIVRSLDAERANLCKGDNDSDAVAMPVFVIVATKFKALSMPILEFSLGMEKMERVQTTDELIAAVKAVQQAALVCNGLARGNIADQDEVTMDLCSIADGKTRYTLYILDQPPARGMGRYAVFIVPQGREIEWLFCTAQGRKKLLKTTGFQRLCIVSLHRDQEYSSLDEVKADIGESIKSLSPSGLIEQIPFLSVGTDLGKRDTLVSGFSKISGNFRIEDVEGTDGKIFRRLIFLSNQFVVQSEALVKTIKPKSKKERKKIDIGYLACQHHLFMSVGVHLVTQGGGKDKLQDVLVVGLGGGGLCSFLHAALPNVRVTAVEIDPIMLEVAEQYFELKQDKRLNVVIDDGLAFIAGCKNEGIHFSAILFDVDSKDLSLGMSCPPQSFLAPAVLEDIKHVLTEKGIFLLNLVCRDETLRDKALQELKQVFASVCCYKIEQEVNEIVYCSKDSKYKDLADWKKVLGASGRNLNNTTKSQKLVDKEMVDVIEFLNDLKL